jgi:hypothetical protein
MASALFAEEGIVKTRDGATYQGEITQTDQSVTIRMRGIDTVIPRGDVLSIQAAGSYDESFQERLSKLEPRDVDGRMALAREAFDRGRYDLSRTALESAIEINPNSRQVSDMLALVQNQVRLQRMQANPPAQAPATQSSRASTPQPGVERRLLTPADIEAIRRAELRQSDTGARIRFEGDVKKRFADSQNIAFTEFNALPTVQQAILIMDKGDSTMRDKVTVLSDPQSILDFRRTIQPLVIQNCATIGCHGGPNGGGVVIYTAGENDAVTYTNFYILQSIAKRVEPVNDTFFNASQRRLIERGRGEESLLANYGLPANIGTYDHPPVNGKPIQPVFRNREDARYRAVVQWMNETLAPVTPDYGIHYTLPTALPTGAPSTAPGQ